MKPPPSERDDATPVPAEPAVGLAAASVSPLPPSAGQPDGLPPMGDANSGKPMEAWPPDSEAEYRALHESMTEAIASVDLTGRIVSFNSAFQTLLGYSAAELRMKSYRDLTPERWRAMEERIVAEQVIPRGRSEVYEKEYRRQDGSLINVELRTSLIRDERGQPFRMWALVRDITERKRDERHLALLNFALDQVHEAAFLTDENARFQYVNDAACRALDYPREDLLALSVADIDPDFPAWRWPEHWAELRERGSLVFATRHRTRSGVLFPVEVRANYFEYAGRGYNLALIHDTTERTRAEAAVRQSESRTRAVIERAPFGAHSYELHPDGRLVLVQANRAADQILGIDHASFLGRTIEEAFPNLRGTPIPSTYRRLAREEGGFEEDQFVYDEGQIKGVFAIHAFHTGPDQMTVFFRDVTEAKRAESALRRSEEELQIMLDSVPAMIWHKDTENRILSVNRAAARLEGLEPEQMRDRSCRDLYPPELAEAYFQDDLAVIRSRQPRLGAPEAHRSPGTGALSWLEVSKVPVFGKTGEVTGIIAFAIDITGRRQAEADREELQAQLLQAQKMESVGRLAGGVAHDFNNMLQVILGNVDLALEFARVDPRLRESLEEIQRSAQRSAELTRQLLAFARKQTISPKVLDLNQAVKLTLKMIQRLIGEEIQIQWNPGVDLWPVRLDPSQIDQVLANLTVNARDAIHGAGQVTITTANATFSAAAAQNHPECVPGDYVVLSVSDTGHGMDAATRAHLFEPFFTTKEQGKGTGLGLATVFGIVKQNQGFIRVESEPRRGATFRIHLPRAAPEAVAAADGVAPPSLDGSEVLLLVEDEVQILNLGRRVLQQHGYEVLVASAPEAALELAAARSEPIHLLITDVVMPGMNGRDLRQRLRAFHPEMKCLFMSGYTADVIAHHGVLEEGVDFLQKPFTSEQLARKVREVLGR